MTGVVPIHAMSHKQSPTRNDLRSIFISAPYRFHFTKSSHHVSLTAFLRLGRMAALRGVP